MRPIRKDLAYTVKLLANIAPLYQTTLYAKVSGYLKWIGPDKGDPVKKGQVVSIIDAPEIEEQYLQAAADYKIKKITFERLKNVWKESLTSLPNRMSMWLKRRMKAPGRSCNSGRSARLHEGRAPYDGTVTARFADPGALIQVATSSATSAIPLFTIMDLSTVRIYANVSQDDSPWVTPGKTHATVTVPELPDRSFSGTITRSTLALDPSTRSLLVEIDLPNPTISSAGDLRRDGDRLARDPQRARRAATSHQQRRQGFALHGRARQSQGGAGPNRNHRRQVGRDYKWTQGRRRGRRGWEASTVGWKPRARVPLPASRGNILSAKIRATFTRSPGGRDTGSATLTYTCCTEEEPYV